LIRHGKERLIEFTAQAGSRHLDYTEIARVEQQAPTFRASGSGALSTG